MQDVKITVTGAAMTGKSTLIALIEKALEDNGYRVNLSHAVPGEIQSKEKRMIRANDKGIIGRHASQVNITLEEQQAPRKGFS